MTSPDSTETWLKLWAAREFGPEVADAAAAVMNKYGMLAARRKYELLDPTIYSSINYNESAVVLAEWQVRITWEKHGEDRWLFPRLAAYSIAHA